MNEEYYSLIPVEYMEDGMRRWIEHGVYPGSFLTAVLENDLKGALSHADTRNLAALWDWGSWLYNYPPWACHGSKEKCAAWAAHNGLAGGEDAPQDPTA